MASLAVAFSAKANSSDTLLSTSENGDSVVGDALAEHASDEQQPYHHVNARGSTMDAHNHPTATNHDGHAQAQPDGNPRSVAKPPSSRQLTTAVMVRKVNGCLASSDKNLDAPI